MSQILDFAESFNKLFKKIMRQLVEKENTAETNRMKTRVMALINATPLLLLEQGSPYIWNYRDDLKNVYNDTDGSFNWSIFLDKDYSSHYASDAANEIHSFVQTVKRVFRDATEDEKETIYDDLCDAVSIIANYRKYCKLNGMPLVE